MVVRNTIFWDLFGGNRSTKSTITGRQAFTAKQAFIDPNAEIEDAKINKEFVNEKKPFIYTQKPQNNHERNPDFTQDSFFKSVFSPSITDKVAQAFVPNGAWMPNRLSGNDSKYGSLSSLGSSNKKEEILGAKLALIG